MKGLTIVLLLCLVCLSLQGRFKINKVFLTTNRWTYNIDDDSGVHQDIVLNPNGKVYNSDNRTEFQGGASWYFNDQQQWVKIYRSSGVCIMNAITVNQNPTYFPDVSIIGIEFGNDRLQHACNIQVVI